MGFGPGLPSYYRDKGGRFIEKVKEFVNSSTRKFKDFDNSEFRFWQADISGDNILTTECRYCGSLLTSSTLRKEHIEKHGCTKLLVTAYKLLGRDRKCVVCDKDTHGEKWGVPLCSDICIDKWCFELPKPPSLLAALELTIRNG